MKRTPFPRKTAPMIRLRDREPGPVVKAERIGAYAHTSTVIHRPKTRPQRNPRLLAMAKMRPCLLMVPGCCNHRLDTTVACHSNQSRHGKAGARKADDQYSVHGCAACHTWLDSGPASQAQKVAAFDAAMRRQVAAWQQITADPSEAPADRKAAQWALDRHTAQGVTP